MLSRVIRAWRWIVAVLRFMYTYQPCEECGMDVGTTADCSVCDEFNCERQAAP